MRVSQRHQGRTIMGLVEHNVRSDVRVFADLRELSLHAAEAAVGPAGRLRFEAQAYAPSCCRAETLHARSTACWHRSLRGIQIPWPFIHVFWGDERYVSPHDPDSNYRLARETLSDHVPCPAANIHPMPTQFPSPENAAGDYERTLRNHFGTDWPHFDLLLLGIGKEGHTASLFPGSSALGERTRWVAAVETPADPPLRLTLTLPVLLEPPTSTSLWKGRIGQVRCSMCSPRSLMRTPIPRQVSDSLRER